MPPLKGMQGAFYAEAGSREDNDLGQSWSNGAFEMRVLGKLARQGMSDSDVNLYLPRGGEQDEAELLLFMAHNNPPATGYSGITERH